MAGNHADRVLEMVASPAAMSQIAVSWRRSFVAHHLQPSNARKPQRLNESEMRIACARSDWLMRAAGPVLDRLFRFVDHGGCCVVFTDADGVILDRRGSAGDDAVFDDWGLWNGAVWSEAQEGTNGIGTCLFEKRPVTIHRDQHFYARNTAMSCMDAPVRDHRGRVVGALDVSSCRYDHTESVAAMTSALVCEAARRLEADHFCRTYAAARILMTTESCHAGPALLAVDRNDLVIGATHAARQAYGLDDSSFESPRPAGDILGQPETGFAEAERAELRRALARTHGNAAAAARMLGIGRATLYRRMERLGISERKMSAPETRTRAAQLSRR